MPPISIMTPVYAHHVLKDVPIASNLHEELSNAQDVILVTKVSWENALNHVHHQHQLVWLDNFSTQLLVYVRIAPQVAIPAKRITLIQEIPFANNVSATLLCN